MIINMPRLVVMLTHFAYFPIISEKYIFAFYNSGSTVPLVLNNLTCTNLASSLALVGSVNRITVTERIKAPFLV